MKYTDGKNIMVYAQSADGAPVGAALETVSKAAELAKANGEEVIAVVFGKDTDTKTVITAGASKVLVAGEEGLPAEEKAQILVKLAEKYQPKAVYMAGTPEGKMIAPAVSAVFESGCVTDVTGITADGVYTSLSYNGNVLNDMKMGENLPHVATVRSGSFAKKLDESRTGEVIAEDASADTVRTKVVETVKEIAETVNLEEAQIIVSGGRGMGSKENFALVEELAEVMGGVVGATRPAIEEGWVSRAHQVGQSGKIVAPKLYIACGISGATQHVSGMIGSGYIVAINKDEDASIFDVADAGIVGDVTKILPVMIEEMKKRKLCMIFLLCLALMTLVAGCRSKKETNDQGNQKGTAIYYTNNDVTKLIMKKENVKLKGDQQQKVKILLKKLQQTPKSDKIRSVIPKRIMINGVSVNTNIVEIDFSTGYKRISGNRDLICRAGIVYTLTQLKDINYVSFSISGEPMLDTDGTAIGALGRDSFVFGKLPMK